MSRFAFIQRHWRSLLILLIGILAVARIWNGETLPAWRESVSIRSRQDSLTQLIQELPKKRKLWLSLRQNQDTTRFDSTRDISQLQALLESSGLEHTPLKILEMGSGVRSVKLSLRGPFPRLVTTIKRLENYGATPIGWSILPIPKSGEVKCDLELHLNPIHRKLP